VLLFVMKLMNSRVALAVRDTIICCYQVLKGALLSGRRIQRFSSEVLAVVSTLCG